MKKFLSLLLSLCLLLGTLPLQVSAFAGDIFPSESTVKTVTLNDGSLSLQNEYIHMTFRKLWGTYAYLTVAPAAKPDEESILIGQTPRCTFTTYDQGREKIEGVVTERRSARFASTRTACPRTGIVTSISNGAIRSTALPPRDIPPRWKSRAALLLK